MCTTAQTCVQHYPNPHLPVGHLNRKTRVRSASFGSSSSSSPGSSAPGSHPTHRPLAPACAAVFPVCDVQARLFAFLAESVDGRHGCSVDCLGTSCAGTISVALTLSLRRTRPCRFATSYCGASFPEDRCPDPAPGLQNRKLPSCLILKGN